MRVLVTGGAGFIGSHVCDALVAYGAEVICFDNLSSGNQKNVSHLESAENFSFVEGDICNLEQIHSVIRQCTHVVHLAAFASVPGSIAEPELSAAINLQGTLNLITAAEKQGIERLVFSSTAAVYGNCLEMPISEDTPIHCLSPYAEHKLAAEKAILSSSIPAISLRYFNVHGPRQSPFGAYAAVIPKFIELMKTHSQPRIFGDGSATRDFVRVLDVAELNLLALISENDEALNQIYNVASGNTISMTELFTSLRDILSRYDPSIASIQPIYSDERVGDIKHSSASIQKATQLLDFNPEKSYEKAFVETIASWF
ncbi:MAG: SDR family NAD(P)-dependent oxidoreductase [Candidatus Thalassarchaeaceae archaeon]|jgi:UDP-N-acetylglucosamine 4-epimerase|nr:SDR family NAD(P)-dependent oxidoreductase [Candidatus Thalassarchaeaceae archaeon]